MTPQEIMEWAACVAVVVFFALTIVLMGCFAFVMIRNIRRDKDD